MAAVVIHATVSEGDRHDEVHYTKCVAVKSGIVWEKPGHGFDLSSPQVWAAR